jgi:hypothetical protein
MYFQELFIWLAREYQLWRRRLSTIFIICGNVLTASDFVFILKIHKTSISSNLIYFRSRFINLSCYECPLYHSHCVCSYLEMLLYALLLHCLFMAPKAIRLSASALQEKYGLLLSQSPFAECESSYFLHQALQNRKPPIDVTVTLVSILWSSLQLVGCIFRHRVFNACRFYSSFGIVKSTITSCIRFLF